MSAFCYLLKKDSDPWIYLVIPIIRHLVIRHPVLSDLPCCQICIILKLLLFERLIYLQIKYYVKYHLCF
jgi:hypothetical protein